MLSLIQFPYPGIAYYLGGRGSLVRNTGSTSSFCLLLICPTINHLTRGNVCSRVNQALVVAKTWFNFNFLANVPYTSK